MQTRASAAKFVGGPDGTAGIVRAAQEDDAALRRQLCAHRIEVHDVATVGLDELDIEDAAVVGGDDLAEGVIGRREQDDFVAGLGDRLQDEAESRNDARCRAHPGRVDVQAVAAPHPSSEGFAPGAGVGVVAVNAARDFGSECFGDAGWACEVHVGDPHGDRIWRGDARELGDHVPFRRVGAAPLDDAVEVEHEAVLRECA